MQKSASKRLSSSHSGDIFFGLDNNEGLKFGDFRFSIYRYKCFGPNETNFMDFGHVWSETLYISLYIILL